MSFEIVSRDSWFASQLETVNRLPGVARYANVTEHAIHMADRRRERVNRFS
jgi:hypothetical protein